MRWVVGTDHGSVDSEGHTWFSDRSVTAVVPDGRAWLALVDGREIVRRHGDEVDPVGVIDDEVGRCLLPIQGGVLVGTAHARLALVHDGTAELLASFDGADGRDRWYTPWGGPADTRDAGETWTFATDGLHARYARAVALDGDALFLSASTGPRGGRAAVYRRDAS